MKATVAGERPRKQARHIGGRPRKQATGSTSRDENMDESSEPKDAVNGAALTLHRLRGWVDGAERTFSLAPGEHLAGSSRESQVVLPVHGVSRRHARLEAFGRGLVVEDLDSRNGTYVNGERIRCREVFTGDLLRLGPVTLEVEAVADEDARLALVLDPCSSQTTPGLDETTAFLSGAPSAEPDVSQSGLKFPEGCVIGRSEAMGELYRALGALAKAELPVLIEGETGVGKESVARTLHLSSPRCHGPFVAINCAAIPSQLLEAELFGIGDGVATGVKKRSGKFRAAEGGTLFLDELAEMSLEFQAKLLRALQEKEIQPLGGESVSVDVRVVAATNHDLLRRVEQGLFRRDLYYRVAGGVLRVPPLRERRKDIAPLIEHFLRQAVATANREIPGVTVRALRALTAYPWPGNVRELEHEMRRLAYLCADGQAIEGTLLSEAFQEGGGAPAAEPAPAESAPPPSVGEEEDQDAEPGTSSVSKTTSRPSSGVSSFGPWSMPAVASAKRRGCSASRAAPSPARSRNSTSPSEQVASIVDRPWGRQVRNEAESGPETRPKSGMQGLFLLFPLARHLLFICQPAPDTRGISTNGSLSWIPPRENFNKEKHSNDPHESQHSLQDGLHRPGPRRRERDGRFSRHVFSASRRRSPPAMATI